MDTSTGNDEHHPAPAATRHCPGCGRALAATEFNRRHEGLQSRCRDCTKADSRRRYREDPTRSKDASRARNDAVRPLRRAEAAAYRETRACDDCGVAGTATELLLTKDAAGGGDVARAVRNAVSQQAFRQVLEASVPLCRSCWAARNNGARHAGPADLAGAPLGALMLRDAVRAVLLRAGKELSAAEVGVQLSAGGRDDNQRSVGATLSRLVADGLVVRTGRGRYRHPDES